jgi:hypothetical protein
MRRMCQSVRRLHFPLVIHYEHIITGRRVLKNIFGGVDDEVEEYRANLIRLRGKFLDHVVVLTNLAVLKAGE